MKVLMLRDEHVYDIDNNQILNGQLFPSITTVHNIGPSAVFDVWNKNRAYLKSNRTAERSVSLFGGEGTIEAKRRLSLSDSYWIKHDYDSDKMFADISPYFNDFSLLTLQSGHVRSSSVPDLVLGGSQPKQWTRFENMATGDKTVIAMSKSEISEQVHAEICAVKLAQVCGLPVMDAFVRCNAQTIYAKKYSPFFSYSELGVIHVVNMTTPAMSLVQFDQLNVGADGWCPENVCYAYRRMGVSSDLEVLQSIALKQVLFDAVVGNGDRRLNNSNWGVFLDTETGKREPSYMYDFNWAVLSVQNTEHLDAVALNVRKRGCMKQEAIIFLESVRTTCAAIGLSQWRENSEYLIRKINFFPVNERLPNSAPETHKPKFPRR